jgi:hypothetical protein
LGKIGEGKGTKIADYHRWEQGGLDAGAENTMAELAEQIRVKLVETSAKTGMGV